MRLALQLQKGGLGLPKTSVEAAVGHLALHLTPSALTDLQAIRLACTAQLAGLLPISAGVQLLNGGPLPHCQQSCSKQVEILSRP